MLSRRDIEKELGKGLSLYPFIPENIKENSINVTISEYAWCQCDMTVYWYGGDKFSIVKSANGANKIKKTINYKKGDKSIFNIHNGRNPNSQKSYLLLFPHQTTILETKEVIGIGNSIGGSVHSKVGIVALGIGDTGTMLGPGYCGHLMISLHNITDDIIILQVDTTFVTLTFNYLHTRVERISRTVPSHFDRLLEHNCKLETDDKTYFDEDWKGNLSLIQEKMQNSSEYQEYKKNIKKNAWKELKGYVNKKNLIALIAVIGVFSFLFLGSYYLDLKTGQSIWVDRFLNVGCSGLIGSILIGIWKFINKN